jgi:hypothetical protein
MAFVPPQVFQGSDQAQRSVWVVVDPRDAVTGGRVSDPLLVNIAGVAAKPIAALSGVYCFTDLKLPADNYTVEVKPDVANRNFYFAAEVQFNLVVVPLPAEPLKRNAVPVQLLPRPAYPFSGQATLARGALVKSSDASPIEHAQIFLIVDSIDQGLKGQTDERGEFVVFFPPTAPEDDPEAALKDLKFQLRFEIQGHAPHLTAEETVKEGTTKSVNQIEFPGT